MFLTAQELFELTHRKYGAWQAIALKNMEIRYRTRPDGTLAVLRADVEGKQDRRPQLRTG